MEPMSNIESLLNNIAGQHGDDLMMDRAAIEKEIAEDDSAYKGLGIKVLSIFGGLLGVAFFMGFVFLALHDSAEGALALGLAFIAGAIALNKASASTILDTACIGTFLAGLGLMASGMYKMHASDNGVTLVLLALAILTPLIASGFMLNFFSVLIISGCLYALISINYAYQFLHLLTALLAITYTYVALYEADIIARQPKLNTRYMAWLNGLLFSFLAILFYWGVSSLHDRDMDNGYISSIIIIIVTGFLIYQLVTSLGVPEGKVRVYIYVISTVVLLSTLFSPAIAGSILMVLLSYRIFHSTGFIVGITALLYFTGQYYYDLHYTLLVKSEIMLASGTLFLMAWFIFKNQLKRYEQN